MFWPIEPISPRNACRVNAWMIAAARITPTTVTRTVAPEPDTIGGMPSSIPTETRNGIDSPAALEVTMIRTSSAIFFRYGRSRSPSSRRDRDRSSTDTFCGSSS